MLVSGLGLAACISIGTVSSDSYSTIFNYRLPLSFCILFILNYFQNIFVWCCRSAAHPQPDFLIRSFVPLGQTPLWHELTSVFVALSLRTEFDKGRRWKIQGYYSRGIISDIKRNEGLEKSPRAFPAAPCLACPRIVAAMPATSKRKRYAFLGALPPDAKPVLDG